MELKYIDLNLKSRGDNYDVIYIKLKLRSLSIKSYGHF